MVGWVRGRVGERVYSEIANEIISYTNCTTKLMINGRVKGCVRRVKWIGKWLVS